MSSPQASFSIIVVGAGLAGLAASLRLAQTGHHVQVLEQKAQLSDAGGSLKLAPNATRIFDERGLIPDILQEADLREFYISTGDHLCLYALANKLQR